MITKEQKHILDTLKHGGKLPMPKGIAVEVISLTQRDDTTNQKVANLIKADPVLSVRVIKAANVLVASTTRPVVTVSDAVTVLGFRALRQMVTSLSLIENHLNGLCKQFDYSHFWAHSLLTAIAARHLTARSKLAAVEDIFTLGLLGRVGQLVLATIYPEKFGAILDSAKENSLDHLCQQEKQTFGFDQGEVSAALLADMNFPAIYQRLIQDYGHPKSSSVLEGSREWMLLNLLHLASLVADLLLAVPVAQKEAVRNLRLEAATLGLEEAFMIEVAGKCSSDWMEWSSLLNFSKRQLPDAAELFKQVDTDADGIRLNLAPVVEEGYKMRVLVVDDDRSIQMLMEKILKNAGHEVTVASNGVEALQSLQKTSPQLVITDWVMPEMDGIALCKALRTRSDSRGLYIIVTTAHEAPGKLVEAFEAGADDFVLKPLVPKMFYARLSAAQRVIQLQEELASDREKLVRLATNLAAVNERLETLALTDALTELHNRRFAMERLEQEWALSQRGGRSLSCLLIDIDHFKSINDRFGHQMGDEALKLVAHTLRQVARTQDVVCRYGGEEFLVICPDTDSEAAFQCAERLRLSVAEKSFLLEDGSKIQVTVSIGVATTHPAIPTQEALLVKADKNLYRAKAKGRNCTITDRP